MMTGQARSSVTIMGLDTNMILETVPVPRLPSVLPLLKSDSRRRKWWPRSGRGCTPVPTAQVSDLRPLQTANRVTRQVSTGPAATFA